MLRHPAVWWVAWAAAIALALMALVQGVARLMLPEVERFRAEVQEWAGVLMGQPVTIGGLEARWHGIGPELILSDVRLFDTQGGSVLLKLDELRAEIAPYASLWHRQLELRRLTLNLPSVRLQRRADGTVRLLGLVEEPTEEGDATSFLEWVLRQGRLEIRSKRLEWADAISGEALGFDDVAVKLRNDGDRHVADGLVGLPAFAGQSARFVADISGDLLHAEDWSGTVYAEGKAVQLGYWLGGRAWQGVALRQGASDFRLWSTWERGKAQRVAGELTAAGLLFDAPDTRGADASAQSTGYGVDRLSGWLDWQRTTTGWRLDGQRMELARGGHTWPRSAFSVDVTAAEGVAPVRYDAQLGYLHVEDLRELALLNSSWAGKAHDALVAMQPAGELRELRLRWGADAGAKREFALQGRYAGLSFRPWEKLPGMTGLEGRLYADHEGGWVALATQGSSFSWPHMFRDALALDTLRGTLRWDRQTQGWRIRSEGLTAANADLHTETSLDLRLPGGDATPFLDIAVAFRDGDGRHTSRYLPVGIMSPDVVHWLDQGIVGARVTSGGMVLHGQGSDFPFYGPTGTFEVSFHIQDAVLRPAEGWPLIEGIEADVRFAGPGLDIAASQARIYSSAVSATRVTIDDMTTAPTALVVRGQVQGPTAEKFRYLLESPLKHQFEPYLKHFEVSGASRLDLQLDLPLTAGAPQQVGGTVWLSDNRVRILPARLDLDRLHGAVQFSGATLSTEKVTGTLQGQPLTLRVATRARGAGVQTVIDAAGELNDAALAGYFSTPLMRQLKGRSPWQARLAVRHTPPRGTPPATLQITSGLKGLSIDLPPPLGKRGDESRVLVITNDFHGDQPARLRFNYGDALSGQFVLGGSADQPGVARGTVRLGSGTARLSGEPGILVTGSLPELSVSRWRELLRAPAVGPATTASLVPAQLSALDLQVGKLELFGQQFSEVRLAASREAEQWTSNVTSRELAGRLVIPDDLVKKPLEMDLEHWYLAALPKPAEAPAAQPGEESFDPQRLPTLRIACKQFRYDGMELGRLALGASRRADGYHIERLTLDMPETRIDLHGIWQQIEQGSQTRIEAQLDSTNVGKALTAFGYADTLRSGTGNAQIAAQWAGAPTDFAAARLSGTLAFDVSNGRLLDVEPGAGRVFGLLSLQTLSRRLSLDFSDLFAKGMSFDRVRGDFEITNGVANTRLLRLESPSALVDITGTVNLARRSYDQRVLIIPHVTENLPVLGALALGPQVGAAILFTQRLFRKQFERITQFEYAITGPWEAPVVKRADKKVLGPVQPQDVFRE